MDTIASRVAAAKKEGKGGALTATTWIPEPGDVLMGELVLREVIKKKDSDKIYDKVTLRTDDGLYDTIIRQGILGMADPPVAKGDLFIITYKGMKDLGGGREMHDSIVEVYQGETREELPF
jgi:hypothetical protein